MFDGELLEGLELIDFDEFTAWCAAEREHARSMHTQVLQALVERLASTPSDALPYARELVRIDPINEEAERASFSFSRSPGAETKPRHSTKARRRMLKELGAKATGPLETAWREAAEATDHREEEPSARAPHPPLQARRQRLRAEEPAGPQSSSAAKKSGAACFRFWMTRARTVDRLHAQR